MHSTFSYNKGNHLGKKKIYLTNKLSRSVFILATSFFFLLTFYIHASPHTNTFFTRLIPLLSL